MNIARTAQQLHDLVMRQLWVTPSMKLSRLIEERVSENKAVAFYTYNCRNYSRVYNSTFFQLSSGIWQQLSLSQWESIIRGISPRPEGVWAWDGGEFCDVDFIAAQLGINAFTLAYEINEMQANDLCNILRYGNINLTRLIPDPSLAEEHDTEDEAYLYIFEERRQRLRQNLLHDRPELDFEQVSKSQVSAYLSELLAMVGC